MAPARPANVPAPSATPHPAPNRRRVRAFLLLPLLAAPLGLAGCGGSSTETAYPSLATVPPRPRLSYGVEQRRAVEGELVRDRANAARVVPEIDYELGRAPAPPPPPPAAQAPEPSPTGAAKADPPRPPGGPGDSPEVEAYVAEAMARAEDEGELKDFMRRLERPAIPTAERPGEGDAPPPRQPSIAGALGLEAQPSPPAVEGPAAAPEPAAGPERPRSEALDRFGGHLGGVLGLDDATATATATATVAPPAAPSPADDPAGVVAQVAFAAGESGLPDGAVATLGRALDEARRRGAGLRIAAGGSDRDLRAGRARAVAAALVRLGAEAGTLELAGSGGGGAGDGEVRVSLARRS